MPTSANGVLAAVADRVEQLAGVLEHHAAPPRSKRPYSRQVERHHLVADQLVDDRLGEQDVLGAAVEAAQQRAHLLRVALLGEAREAADVGEEDAGVGRHPARRCRLDAGRAEVRALARRAGNRAGATSRPPMPANGAPQMPQRGLDGSERRTRLTVRPAGSEAIAK